MTFVEVCLAEREKDYIEVVLGFMEANLSPEHYRKFGELFGEGTKSKIMEAVEKKLLEMGKIEEMVGFDPEMERHDA